MLGDSGHGRIVSKQMKIIHMRGFTTEELQGYKSIVKRNLHDIMEAIESAVRQFNTEIDATINVHAQNLSQELRKMWDGDSNISLRAVEAAQGLRASEQLTRFWASTNVDIPFSASYFLEEAKRVSEEDFIPIESDILRTHVKATGVQENKFKMGELFIHMFDIGHMFDRGVQRTEQHKWIHQFHNVTSIIFSVDISCYDQVLLEE